MRVLILSALSLVLGPALGSQITTQSATQDRLTSRDFSLGHVPESADTGAVLTAFGEPDSVVNSQYPTDWLVQWYYDGLEVRFADDGTMLGFMITQPGLSTSRGLSVGDPASQVRSLYGEPHRQTEASSWDYDEDREPTQDGVATHTVEIGIEGGIVRWIYVGWIIVG